MNHNRAGISHIHGALGPMECIAAEYRSHRFTPHFHDTYVVGVVTAGAARTRYCGETAVLRPGSVFVIEPGEVHDGQPVGDDGYRYRAFYPSIAEMRAAAVDGASPPHFAQLQYENPELAAQALSVREEESGAGDGSTSVTRLLRDLVCLYGDAAPSHELRERRAVRLVRAHVDAFYATRVALSTLSAISGMSTFHLIRVFRQEVGLPPGMYLQLVRIQRASEMLRAGLGISQVAYAAGFSDQSHLTRRFRRIMGVTPAVYARVTHARTAPGFDSARVASLPDDRRVA